MWLGQRGRLRRWARKVLGATTLVLDAGPLGYLIQATHALSMGLLTPRLKGGYCMVAGMELGNLVGCWAYFTCVSVLLLNR